MSFLKGIRQKVRSALVRAPKTVDSEYDDCVARMKGIDICLSRITKQLTPLVEHVSGFVKAADNILHDLEVLSDFEAKVEKRSRPWNKNILYRTRLNYTKLLTRLRHPRQYFEKAAGSAIQLAEKQLAECRKLDRIRETARVEYDVQREKLRKTTLANEQKATKGVLITDKELDNLRDLAIDSKAKEEHYKSINKEAKGKWKAMIEERNNLAHKVFEGLSRLHRGVTTAFIITVQQIDQDQSPFLREFYSQKHSEEVSAVQRISSMSGFGELHPEVLLRPQSQESAEPRRSSESNLNTGGHSSIFPTSSNTRSDRSKEIDVKMSFKRPSKPAPSPPPWPAKQSASKVSAVLSSSSSTNDTITTRIASGTGATQGSNSRHSPSSVQFSRASSAASVKKPPPLPPFVKSGNKNSYTGKSTAAARNVKNNIQVRQRSTSSDSNSPPRQKVEVITDK